jgi:MFS family permease
MQFTFGVFLIPLTQEFGWSRSETSMALVVGLTMTAICVPFAGRLIDRYGVRAVTLPSILLVSACLVALSQLSTTPEMFIGIYALMGVAAAGQTPLPYSKAIASWFDDKRGLALGIAISGVGLGAALVPQFTQYLVSEFSWKGAYLGLAVLVLLVGFPAVAIAVREAPSYRTGKGDVKQSVPGYSAREAMRTVNFWKLVIVFFSVALATNGTIAHVVPLLVDRGMDASIAVGAMAVTGFALMGGRLLAGYLLDRFHAPYVAAAFIAMPLAGLLLLLSATDPMYASVAVVLVGMGLGAEVDLIAYLLSRYLGMRSFGEIYGYFFSIFMLGSGVGPYLMGFAFDVTGSYDIAIVGLAMLLFFSCIFLPGLGAYRYPSMVEKPEVVAMAETTA